MAEISLKERLRARQSRKFCVWITLARPNGCRSQTITRRSGSAKGRGRSSTAFTTLKIAVVAPMPSASTAIAVTREAGRFAQQAQGEPRIAGGPLQGGPAPGFAGGFAHQRYVAEVAPRAGRVLAALATQLRLLLQVKVYFFLKVPLFARPAPKLHRSLLAVLVS